MKDHKMAENSQAYKEGYVAYAKFKHSIDDCPYDDLSQEADDWIDGYKQAGMDEILNEHPGI